MIYVTVGTMFLDFPRLIRKMDEIARDTGERVIVQTGMGETYPAHCEHFSFKPREEVVQIQGQSRLVVCHAGIGSVLEALELRKPLIVVPRLKGFREHMNDHQLDLAEAVERRGWGRMIVDVKELPEACANPPAAVESYAPAKHRLVAAVRDAVDRVAAVKGQRSR